MLDRLTAQGLVALDREEVHQGRLRRHYRLTDEGAAALEQEAARMAANAAAARARLRTRPAGAPASSLTATPWLSAAPWLSMWCPAALRRTAATP